MQGSEWAGPLGLPGKVRSEPWRPGTCRTPSPGRRGGQPRAEPQQTGGHEGVTPGPASWGGHQEWGRRGSPRGWDHRARCWRSSPSSPRPSPPGLRAPGCASCRALPLLRPPPGPPCGHPLVSCLPPRPAAQALVPPPTEAASPGAPAPVLPCLVAPFSLCRQQLQPAPPRESLLPASPLVHQGQVSLQGQSSAPQWDRPPCGIQSHSIWAPTPSLRVHQPEPLPPPRCVSLETLLPLSPVQASETGALLSDTLNPWVTLHLCDHRGARRRPAATAAGDALQSQTRRVPALQAQPHSHPARRTLGTAVLGTAVAPQEPQLHPRPHPQQTSEAACARGPSAQSSLQGTEALRLAFVHPKASSGDSVVLGCPTVWRGWGQGPILFSLLPALSPCSSDFCTC